jgi:hypothetical protein
MIEDLLLKLWTSSKKIIKQQKLLMILPVSKWRTTDRHSHLQIKMGRFAVGFYTFCHFYIILVNSNKL